MVDPIDHNLAKLYAIKSNGVERNAQPLEHAMFEGLHTINTALDHATTPIKDSYAKTVFTRIASRASATNFKDLDEARFVDPDDIA